MHVPNVVIFGGTALDILVKGVDTKHALQEEITPAESISISLGGDGFNQAISISKLGGHVRFACGVGSDFGGGLIMQTLERYGVDVSYLVKYPSLPSCLNCVVIDPTGERRFLMPPFSESIYFTPCLEMIQGVKVISLASLFTPPIVDPNLFLPILQAAREQGILVCADTNMNKLGLTLEDFSPLLPYVDYLFPNEEESFFYTGQKDVLEAARVFQEFGIANIIAKQGAKGCYICTKDASPVHIPSYPTHCLDTTGAGDNFASGFIFGLLQGWDIVHCCQWASATAAIAVSAVGATTALQGREQVEQVIAKGGLF